MKNLIIILLVSMSFVVKATHFLFRKIREKNNNKKLILKL